MSTPRLVTISFSHYCEKARWGLDRAGVAFVEDGHLPFFHVIPAARVGGRTVPILVTDDGVVPDSTDILRWADARAPADRRLYPEGHGEAALALEEGFDRDLGPHTRRWAYGFLLRQPRLIREICQVGAPAWERRTLPMVFPVARAVMRRVMKIDPPGVERSQGKIDRVFEQVEGLLADGRRYLVGDRFTAADLTFAALAAPVVYPPEYTIPFPPRDRFPAAIQATIEGWRSRPAGAFALRLFAEERRRRP
ncbi:MAG: glutathione S-transferase family protein [Nannocystaceae bacterium]